MSHSNNNNNNNNNNAGPLGMSHITRQMESPVEQVQQWRREAEERWRWEDAELAAELAVSQLVEEEMTWKEERWKLVEAKWWYEEEKKWREAEKAKGKKRKVEEESESDEGCVKRKREVSTKQIIKHTY